MFEFFGKTNVVSILDFLSLFEICDNKPETIVYYKLIKKYT